MGKRRIYIGIAVFILLAVFLLVYPRIEFITENELIALRYSDDISEFETELSLDENYMYYEKYDISIHEIDIEKFGFFYVIRMGYIEGNYCETEFLLKETYIEDFIERAVIEYNSHDVDVEALIEGKEAVVGNTRYFTDDEKMLIEYSLDDVYEVMYLFEAEGLFVIQVGEIDEGPKFIAYK